MIKPVRIQRSRKHKQESPNGLPIVYVGRPGKWGNKYKVGEYSFRAEDILSNPFSAEPKLVKTADEAIRLYREDLEREIRYNRLDLSVLRGKNLSCWCKVGNPCHADVLLDLANR